MLRIEFENVIKKIGLEWRVRHFHQLAHQLSLGRQVISCPNYGYPSADRLSDLDQNATESGTITPVA